MARRADWDNDDFEILNEIPSIKSQDKFEFIEEDSFEIVPSTNKLINTNPIQHVPIIKKPVPTSSIKIDKPMVNELKQSLENSSPLSINLNYLPIRYGSAAIIPHDDSFDLKSILHSKPSLSNPINDLMSILQDEKPKQCSYINNNLQQLLIDNNHNRINLIQMAKKTQQDFINAIHLN